MKKRDERDVEFFKEKPKASHAPATPPRVVEEGASIEPLLNHPSAHASNNRFVRALRRIRSSKKFKATYDANSPYGIYNGRPVIGECTHIHGGIYVGAFPQEAIVIDEKYGGLLDVYQTLRERSQLDSTITASEYDLLRDIFQLTIEKLRFIPDAVKAIIDENQAKTDEKIVLDLFVRAGQGVSRHRVLLAAYLIEKLRIQKLLKGTVSIDHRMTTSNGDDEQLVYTAPSGELVTFNPRAHK